MHLRKCRGGREVLKGRSPLMGVCADIGHWKRVGEDPLKNLQKLSGRIKVAHLKDLTDKMEDATVGNRDLTGKSVRQRAEASAFQRAYLH